MSQSTLADRLRALFPDSSGRSLKQWLEAGRVAVNGRVSRDGRAVVRAHDRVELGGRGRTAYRMLWDYLAAQRPRARPFIVHRLDRETSGLLVFAKSPEAKERLQAQFEARTVERIYVALVKGHVRRESGMLETRLSEDRSLRVHAARGPEGKTAITNYRVLSRGQDTTRLELSLGTGRRRQIRVQLATLGHPIVGDREHGGPGGQFRRLCLHATRLAFAHPGSGKAMRFESAAPAAWV